MASTTIGRTTCPIGCGHAAAFVKLKTDKGEDRTAYPYVHCPDCGVQMHTRSKTQAEHLLRNTRLEKGAQDAPKAPEATKGHTPEEKPAKPVKNAPAGLFALFGGASGSAS